MATLSPKAARVLISQIREENGGISPEDRAVSPPGVLRALENVRRKLGAATKTLATNLYSKDTRFVYELIQNAEDNKYTRAEAEGSELYLSFNLYPDRIEIESNEDGFCEEDVRAICSTGESTKTFTQGYIGEKGIGFKSVFKVAKKVHIQSGPFSFSFEYTKDSDDDGLGMVTPLDEDCDDLPDDVKTRITLTLLDPTSFEQRVQDLLNIPNALLLFLTKLDALHINIYPRNESTIETDYIHSKYDEDTNLEAIKITTTVDGESAEETQDFYVVRKEINNLPRDPARKHTNQATVVLAFPVDEKEEPIITQQHVFAFLPLRLAGFSFLIQSDFITQASREDVFHSKRNEYLLSGVAETFRDAVLQFCTHPTLQYQWMRFLPSDSISDEFWKSLRPKIVSLLSKTRCLRPWSETSLQLPGKLYRVGGDAKDKNSQPLFADLDDEAYLSQKYTFRDYKALNPLGTCRINIGRLIARLQADLRKENSKMKASATDDSWHTRTAKLLSVPFEKGNKTSMKTLESLDLIPLQDNTWVSAMSLPVFFPSTGDISIPTSLGLNLVKPATVLNAARKVFLMHLGVEMALSTDIISLISDKYSSSCRYGMWKNISHLRYLYWTLPEEDLTLDENIFLVDQNRNQVLRKAGHMKYIYFEKEDVEYGPEQLFQSISIENFYAPGLDVHFLNEAYLGAVPIEAIHHGRSWKQWLSEFAGVQSYPQLLDPTASEISDEFEYITQYRPEKLVGLLKRYWSFYETQMIPSVIGELRKCEVGSDEESALELECTFLPLPKLKDIIEELTIVHFPFLAMPEELTDEDEHEWHFLKRFGVRSSGGSDNLHFYVEALGRIADENRDDGCSANCLEALFKVYDAIARHCSGPDEVTYVRDYFEENEVIYIPSDGSQDFQWLSSEECVWAAPKWLEAKSRLDGVSKFSDCEHLFRIILKIGDATWQHYLQDLENLKEEDRGNIERVVDIYRRLWREFEHDSNWEKIRLSFEGSALVFLPSQNTWCPLSSCIWADDQVRLLQKEPIRTPYANLEDFFCRILGVKKPNLEMHIQALKELARSTLTPSAAEIKRTMMLISSMDPTADDVSQLRRSNIFSVIKTNGQIALTNSTADFAINDRSEYGSAFSGKIRVLDYSIKEVRACRSLLLALDLQRRHLSELVEETTTVQDGVFNTELTRNFQSKAYALFRYTVHYHSQKSRDGDKSLYGKLLDASIYVSDGITKSISLVQYGQTVTVENSRAKFHMDEDDGQLQLYIPRDKNAREECFFRQLPRRLMTYFEISDPTAEALLGGIMGCRSLVAVDGILNDAGIVEVDGIERSSESGPGSRQSSCDNTGLEEGTLLGTDNQASGPRSSTPSSIIETPHTASIAQHSAHVPYRSPSFDEGSLVPSEGPLSSPEGLVFSTPPVSNAIRNTGYAALLERVIRSAGRITIPAVGDCSVDILQNLGPGGTDLFESVFTSRSVERDRKVGAAGELLVFEILSNLDLSGFDEDNWKSTIRKEVRIHHKYRNLEPWFGRETADITYADNEGDLTKLFIEEGYLPSDTWDNERPTYYLEVKTTTKDCTEQFYMSGSQYNRMQKMQLNAERACSKVYVILRVFNLEGRIGLRVYVDPEFSRLDRELEFKVDTWAVKSI